MASELLSGRELSRWLGVCPETVRAWTLAGAIPVFLEKKGSHGTFRRYCLDDVLESLKTKEVPKHVNS